MPISFEEWKEKCMQDPEFVEAYLNLQLPAEVGNAILRRRLAMGLSQKDLAHLVNRPEKYIESIEDYSKLPSLRELEQIAEALDCKLVIRLEVKDDRS